MTTQELELEEPQVSIDEVILAQLDDQRNIDAGHGACKGCGCRGFRPKPDDSTWCRYGHSLYHHKSSGW